MPDLIFILILTASTAVLIALIRLAVGLLKRPCEKPEAELRVFFDDGCECVEYTLSRFVKSPALRDFRLHLTVVDRIGTLESEAWLNELKRKLGFDFIIETEANTDS